MLKGKVSEEAFQRLMLYAPFRKGLLRREDECARPRSSSRPSCSDGLPCGRNAMALWRPEFDDPMAAGFPSRDGGNAGNDCRLVPSFFILAAAAAAFLNMA